MTTLSPAVSNKGGIEGADLKQTAYGVQLDLRSSEADIVQQHPFYCVQTFAYSRIRSIGGVEPRVVGRTYLTLENIQYIFYEFLRRFTEETGTEVLPENQSLDFFAEMLFETFYGLLDDFDNYGNPTNAELLANTMAWNKLTVDHLLVRTMRVHNRQQNYVRRYKDYKYGALRITPVKPTSKRCKRIEANLLQNYAAIGTSIGKPRYPVRDYC